MKLVVHISLVMILLVGVPAALHAQEARDAFESGADEPSPLERDKAEVTVEDDAHNNNPNDPFESDIHDSGPPEGEQDAHNNNPADPFESDIHNED